MKESVRQKWSVRNAARKVTIEDNVKILKTLTRRRQRKRIRIAMKRMMLL